MNANVPQSRWKEIIDRYEQWVEDDEGQTVTDLAEELGISRQRLYEVLSEHEVPTKAQRKRQRASRDSGDAVSAWDDELLNAMADNALEFLLERLCKAEAVAARCLREHGDLDRV